MPARDVLYTPAGKRPNLKRQGHSAATYQRSLQARRVADVISDISDMTDMTDSAHKGPLGRSQNGEVVEAAAS
jgi:hypothetical protein